MRNDDYVQYVEAIYVSNRFDADEYILLIVHHMGTMKGSYVKINCAIRDSAYAWDSILVWSYRLIGIHNRLMNCPIGMQW
jgi:hypothetical protein